MRLSSFIGLAVLALPILLHSPGALSAERSKEVASSCGVTTRDAVAAAEKALTEKGGDSQTRAIACLLAAIKKLEAERLDVLYGGKVKVLDVPKAFRLMQQQAMAVGQRRVEVGLRIAALVGPPG